MIVKRTNIRILADVRKVLLRKLDLDNNLDRIRPIVTYISKLKIEDVKSKMQDIYLEFDHRHPNLKAKLLANYNSICEQLNINFEDERKLLLGSYFTHEYSIQGSALFNPSMVLHPNQSGLETDEIRFILSLRATGEGHISSIVFHTGVVNKEKKIVMDPIFDTISEGKIINCNILKKKDIKAALNSVVGDFEGLVDHCTKKEVKDFLQNTALYDDHVAEMYDRNYKITFEESTPLSGRVLFPHSKQEKMGMEDVRFVRFVDNYPLFVGTYTAYDGKNIRLQLITTKDFKDFKIQPLLGPAARDKGAALFPRKINGKFAMIGRQGGRNMSIMFSDDLNIWKESKFLQGPTRDWEMLQMGNNGSPIETDKGWLLLTHAVGPMRKYVLSTSLLDLRDPSIVIASLEKPILSPNEEEREGYVPNVLYTCGLMVHLDTLYIPYAMSDNAVSFATVSINEVLNELLK